jgi:peptide deformylase
MIKLKDILDEKDKRLKMVSKEVEFPLTDKDKKAIEDMIEYLTNSQIEEVAEELDLRPGMGLSAIQLGIPKRYFVIVEELPREENEPQKFKNYIIVNPKLVSHSEEMIYADMGEGCLSVNREVVGIVPRYARVTLEGYDIDGNKITVRGREEVAIAFQHEIDHLNGILFFEHIDPKNPYKGENTMRAI